MGAATPLAICLAAVCHNPRQDVAKDRVDLIELNHFYDEKGQLVFDQIIFYDWPPERCRFNVRAWRWLKRPAQTPNPNARQRKFTVVWYDGSTLRRVEAPSIRESWTQYDPELVQRALLPKDMRRELTKQVVQSTGAVR